MDDLISRQAALDMIHSTFSKSLARQRAEECINKVPAVQTERKKGVWIYWHEKIENDSCTEYIPHCKCSECGTEYDSHTVKFINYCPNCGACMKGEQDEAD